MRIEKQNRFKVLTMKLGLFLSVKSGFIRVIRG